MEENIITLEEIFIGMLCYPEQLLFNIALTQRVSEKEQLEELHERMAYYAEAIPDYLMNTKEYVPETITVDINEDISNKMLLDGLSDFIEAICDYADDTGDEMLLEMSEELLTLINQTLLSSSIEFLN